MLFPVTRLRRLRRTPALRNMLQEVKVSVNDLIYPMFVIEGENVKNPVSSMPGVYQYSLDNLLFEVEKVVNKGIPAIILFGIPGCKDSVGSGAYAQDGIIQKSVLEIKKSFPRLVVITDVCLCEYTDHGHCGLIKDNDVDNDSTLELLAKTAVTHAQAGADIVAPSDMMDGRVAAIRKALDNAHLYDTLIMSYSAKYASSFYGPFRDAAGSAPQFGDRKTYQMDPCSGVKQAILETKLDIEEGADLVIVKPALAYMDIIKAVHDQFLCPVVSYNVSGEYSMIKAAAEKGWINEKSVVLELMAGLKRAGSQMIITYHAPQIADWLKEV
ncbi:MAG: porphobilinogen synthase [Clostridia bacterium]|nr:porphobilinogen synthase [Clostridia bacterium]